MKKCFGPGNWIDFALIALTACLSFSQINGFFVDLLSRLTQDITGQQETVSILFGLLFDAHQSLQ